MYIVYTYIYPIYRCIWRLWRSEGFFCYKIFQKKVWSPSPPPTFHTNAETNLFIMCKSSAHKLRLFWPIDPLLGLSFGTAFLEITVTILNVLIIKVWFIPSLRQSSEVGTSPQSPEKRQIKWKHLWGCKKGVEGLWGPHMFITFNLGFEDLAKKLQYCNIVK